MGSAVMVIARWPDGQQPPSSMNLKRDARWPNSRLRMIRRVELIDVPKGGLLQRRRQRLLSHNAAPDLTLSLGRILDAYWFLLCSAYPCKEQDKENNQS
jgi:hypothetical protein